MADCVVVLLSFLTFYALSFALIVTSMLGWELGQSFVNEQPCPEFGLAFWAAMVAWLAGIGFAVVAIAVARKKV